VARSNAFLTLAIGTAGILLNSYILIGVLLVDYFIRGFGNNEYSVLTQIGKKIVTVLNIKPKPINAGPKIFAAQVGFIFSTAIFTGIIAGVPLLVLIAGGTLLFCALLEFAFAYCVACQLYPYLRSITTMF